MSRCTRQWQEANRLREWRGERSPATIADTLDVSPNTYASWEDGHAPSYRHCEKLLAKGFNPFSKATREIMAPETSLKNDGKVEKLEQEVRDLTNKLEGIKWAFDNLSSNRGNALGEKKGGARVRSH